MIKEIGFSWPIAATMSSPHSDRVFRRALIWAGSTFLGVQQADWIAEILRPQIHVTVASGDEETFTSEFSNPEYDAVWVTTHGEFDHMDPHRSKLVINEDTEMTFNDLRKIRTPAQGRRLVILDACDSGAEPIWGFIKPWVRSTPCLVEPGSHLLPLACRTIRIRNIQCFARPWASHKILLWCV
jgi:hypothetical protein